MNDYIITYENPGSDTQLQMLLEQLPSAEVARNFFTEYCSEGQAIIRNVEIG